MGGCNRARGVVRLEGPKGPEEGSKVAQNTLKSTDSFRILKCAGIAVVGAFAGAVMQRSLSAHGVQLSFAAELDWDAALVWVDERFEYGELRMIALAPETQTLYYVAFVDRGEVRRVISLRRATRREVKHYVENV